MDNLTSLKADIESGLCTLIKTYNKGLSYIVYCKGLLFTIQFGEDGEVIDCNPSDKKWNFTQFVKLHGEFYTFSHVLFRNTHHFIYVKPESERPWMKKSIGSSFADLHWCIQRHFTQENGPLPNLFKVLANQPHLAVNHYIRVEDSYQKVSADKLLVTNVGLGDLFIEPTSLRS